MYFENFPTIYYEFDIGGKKELRIVTDVTANVRVRKYILENIAVYDEYDIKDGETPEIIADKLYGSVYYHWVIMLLNDKFDYLEDFPMPTNEFEQYLKDKYGPNIQGIHHYETPEGYVVNSDYPGAVPVTNYNWEDQQNNAKRRIKVLSKSSLANLINQFKDLI